MFSRVNLLGYGAATHKPSLVISARERLLKKLKCGSVGKNNIFRGLYFSSKGNNKEEGSMLSLFKLERDNMFRVYALIFISIATVERYFLYSNPNNYLEPFSPFFYMTNSVRILGLIIPFLFQLFFHRKQLLLDSTLSNTPFLILSIMVLALPSYQLIYFCLFLISCVFVKALRRFATVSILSLFLSVTFGTIIMYLNFGSVYIFLLILSCLFVEKFRLVIFTSMPITFFFMIVIMGSVGSSGREKINTIKSNTHTFHSVLETYAAEHKGVYPESSKVLYEVASKGEYWEGFTNPFTGKKGYSRAFSDISENDLQQKAVTNLDILGVRFTKWAILNEWSGQVLYKRINKRKYAIYGGTGYRKLVKDRGVPFVLTNSY